VLNVSPKVEGGIRLMMRTIIVMKMPGCWRIGAVSQPCTEFHSFLSLDFAVDSQSVVEVA
jgi:hypothetical protein